MSHITEEEMRKWGNRKIPGYTGDPGQRGQRSSPDVKRKRWNKLLSDLDALFNPPIPPGQQPGRPRTDKKGISI